MRRAPRATDRLDCAVAANDEVVSVEVEAFNRRREERQVVAIPAAGPRETLHRRLDPMPFDRQGHRSFDVDERVEGRVRKQLADG